MLTRTCTPNPFGLSLSKPAPFSLRSKDQREGFDNGQVQIAPSNLKPVRGTGDLTISPNGF